MGLLVRLRGTNKTVHSAKLLPMTIWASHGNCGHLCPLLDAQHCCLCPNGRYNLPQVSHSLTPIQAIHDITLKNIQKFNSVSYVGGKVVYLYCELGMATL